MSEPPVAAAVAVANPANHIVKAQYRQFAKKLLAALPLSQLSASVCTVFSASEIWQSAQRVLLYVAMADELSVNQLLDHGIKSGKSCYIPKLIDGRLAYSQVDRLDYAEYLTRSYLGFLELPDECCIDDDFGLFDLILVPGLMFDRRGYRLGRGKAFYDSVLPTAQSAETVGIVPSELVREQLGFIDAWDYRVRHICTEHAMQPAT